LGGHGYDLLIVLNRFVNHVLEKLGRDKISLSKRIKDGVKTAVSFISDFEQIAADLAIERGYDYVICGHIHQPVIKTMTSSSPPAPGQEARTVTYLNSGDWIENLTALEYHLGQWTLHRYAARPDEIRENAPFPTPCPTPSSKKFFPWPRFQPLLAWALLEQNQNTLRHTGHR
jgi:hypothetical protein